MPAILPLAQKERLMGDFTAETNLKALFRLLLINAGNLGCFLNEIYPKHGIENGR